MESLKGASTLHDEWEKVKENLKGVDENIKKLYGRDPTDNRQPQRRVSRGDGPVGGPGGRGAAAGRLFGEARRIINNPNREPIGNRPVGGMDRLGGRPTRTVSLEGSSRLGNIRSRLGPKRGRESDEDMDSPSSKPAVQSSVVLQSKEAPKREDSIAMKTDKKGMARNRRMFGALLGTLQQFQSDSKREASKEQKRAEVEKKLEQKAREEKEQLKQERAALWSERREKEKELRNLEYKMRVVKMFEVWEREIRKQANFIKTTKSKPYIFYKPKIMLAANNRALDDTEDFIDGLISDRKEKLEAEITKIMSKPIRRKRSPDADGKGKDRSDKSEDDDSESEGDSDASDLSDIEEGEVPSRKRVRRDSTKADDDVVVKIEKDAVVKKEPQEEDVEDRMEKEAEPQVSMENVGTNDNTNQFDESMETEVNQETGKKQPQERKSRSPIRRSHSPRRTSDSESSRSRSRSPKQKKKRTPPKNNKTKASNSKKDHSGSSSGSDSDHSRGSKSSRSSSSRSRSRSGSDSERS